MTRANTLIWVTLMLLTALSYFLGEKSTASGFILLLAGVKFTLVAWQFMDLRHAYMRWSVGLVSLLVLVLGIAAFLI
ncbi:MAG: cytochrome C oxidase subunit IV family protein [Verrucomicrobiaceae bacterium]|nr:cytochrome C oxidase subunit IV family protein [Verrucomicrobiaceae bacterium]